MVIFKIFLLMVSRKRSYPGKQEVLKKLEAS